jgi:hypothetical protein
MLCPICDSKPDPNHKKCFHCSTCWFTECGHSDLECVSIVARNLDGFRKSMAGIRFNYPDEVTKALHEPLLDRGVKGFRFGCQIDSKVKREQLLRMVQSDDLTFSPKDESGLEVCHLTASQAINLYFNRKGVKRFSSDMLRVLNRLGEDLLLHVRVELAVREERRVACKSTSSTEEC